VVEGVSRKRADELMGRTENNRIVNFPAPARLLGTLADIRITAAMSHTLRGEVVTHDPVSPGAHSGVTTESSPSHA